MTELEASFARISTTLDSEQLRWAVVGGFAVSVRTEPRFTRDIDLAVAVADDHRAEAVTRTLTANGFEVFKFVDQADTGRLALVRFTDTRSAGGRVIVDLLFASSGIEPEITASAEPVEVFPGLVMPVAGIGHLIAVKLLARDDETRPQDRSDLHTRAGRHRRRPHRSSVRRRLDRSPRLPPRPPIAGHAGRIDGTLTRAVAPMAVWKQM